MSRIKSSAIMAIPSDAGTVTTSTMWTARLTSGANSSVIGFPCCGERGEVRHTTTAVTMKTGMPTHRSATTVPTDWVAAGQAWRMGTSSEP